MKRQLKFMVRFCFLSVAFCTLFTSCGKQSEREQISEKDRIVNTLCDEFVTECEEYVDEEFYFDTARTVVIPSMISIKGMTFEEACKKWGEPKIHFKYRHPEKFPFTYRPDYENGEFYNFFMCYLYGLYETSKYEHLLAKWEVRINKLDNFIIEFIIIDNIPYAFSAYYMDSTELFDELPGG